MRLLIAIPALAMLAACASSEGANRTYAERFAELRAECQARGGVLLPAIGPQSDNPAADYPCQLQDAPGVGVTRN